MLHHISLGVTDIMRAIAFYDAALAPLGYVRIWSDLRPGEPDQAVGYGLPGGGDKLTLKHRPDEAVGIGTGFHLTIEASGSESVDAFFAAAIQHGGTDNGSPGLRPRYGPGYYAAFVCDPDGHRLEAVDRIA